MAQDDLEKLVEILTRYIPSITDAEAKQGLLESFYADLTRDLAVLGAEALLRRAERPVGTPAASTEPARAKALFGLFKAIILCGIARHIVIALLILRYCSLRGSFKFIIELVRTRPKG